MMIFNLRGTNGSGKTTVARAVIQRAEATPRYSATKRKKVEAYVGELHGKEIAILGSYENVCGGMDTVSDIRDAAELITRYADEFPQVFYEGLFISHMIGTVGAAVRPYGDRAILAFLDTPLDVCIDRVIERRKERGDLREFDPKNVIKDFSAVQNCRRNCIAQGFNVVDINHQNATRECFRLMKKAAQS
jgi:uridine kinase